MSSWTICLMYVIASRYQHRLCFTSSLETGGTGIVYQLILTRMKLQRRKCCKIIVSVRKLKSKLSVALAWRTRYLRKSCAIKWQQLSTHCVELSMPLIYTLLLKTERGEILKRNKILNILMSMNPLLAFL